MALYTKIKYIHDKREKMKVCSVGCTQVSMRKKEQKNSKAYRGECTQTSRRRQEEKVSLKKILHSSSIPSHCHKGY